MEVPSEWTDRMGSVASSICAIHCAICGLLPAAFTALGLGFLLGHEAEWLFSITAILLGFFALILGWRQHRSPRIAALLALGIVGLLLSRGLEMGLGHDDHHGFSHQEEGEHDESTEHADEHSGDSHASEHADEHHEPELADADMAHVAGTVVGVLAGLLLLFGHILNIRMARRCREECCEAKADPNLRPVSLD